MRGGGAGPDAHHDEGEDAGEDPKINFGAVGEHEGVLRRDQDTDFLRPGERHHLTTPCVNRLAMMFSMGGSVTVRSAMGRLARIFSTVPVRASRRMMRLAVRPSRDSTWPKATS